VPIFSHMKRSSWQSGGIQTSHKGLFLSTDPGNSTGPNLQERVKNFYEVGLDDSDWETIPVPANWEVEGHGHPIYLDERYPFTTNWPDAPVDYNPVGSYRHIFSIPEAWTNQQIILHFAAAKSAMHLYINGQFTGYSQGSKTPAEFDITSFVTPGENLRIAASGRSGGVFSGN